MPSPSSNFLRIEILSANIARLKHLELIARGLESGSKRERAPLLFPVGENSLIQRRPLAAGGLVPGGRDAFGALKTCGP